MKPRHINRIITACVSLSLFAGCASFSARSPRCELHGCPMIEERVPIEYKGPEHFDEFWRDFMRASQTFFPHYGVTKLIQVDPNLNPFAGPDDPRPTHASVWACEKCTHASKEFVNYLTTIQMQQEEIERLRTNASTATNQPALRTD